MGRTPSVRHSPRVRRARRFHAPRALTQHPLARTPARLHARPIRLTLRAQVLPLPSARVPIVKFVDRASRLQCDICVNNLLALNNTALLGAYARADGRVRPLVATVKYWAAQRKVNEPYRGTLSSCALRCARPRRLGIGWASAGHRLSIGWASAGSPRRVGAPHLNVWASAHRQTGAPTLALALLPWHVPCPAIVRADTLTCFS